MEEETETMVRKYSAHLDKAQDIIDSNTAVNWVAFDGGIHFDTAKFNSIRTARRSIEKGAKILNVDLSMTADKQLGMIHLEM